MGATGETGPTGAAATIQIGTVTTGDPGTPAEVTNAGDENAAIFDFVIPRGADGGGGTPEVLATVDGAETFFRGDFTEERDERNGRDERRDEGDGREAQPPMESGAERI